MVRQSRRDEGGVVIVYFALAVVILMGMAAFVVDLGYWYYQASRVQRAADAASLAGVVYMPGDFNDAATTADTVAADNGFSTAKGDAITVSPVANEPNQLNVTIQDPGVPTFFAKVFGMKSVSETRTATAEYIPSIPLGSPENSFGTGNLSLGTGSPTNIWAAVNGYCTSKENGDEFLSAWDDTYANGNWDCPDEATHGGIADNGAPNLANYEYSAKGYYYDIV
ncbi:MAG TPA: TadE/TadG family type IV pilus assembly protein, partial [Acidimicrobiales bacterium]|nr:TadE/TadG family type IV pilus assembly protein [Acidimicrobiales bacterium]